MLSFARVSRTARVFVASPHRVRQSEWVRAGLGKGFAAKHARRARKLLGEEFIERGSKFSNTP